MNMNDNERIYLQLMRLALNSAEGVDAIDDKQGYAKDVQWEKTKFFFSKHAIVPIMYNVLKSIPWENPDQILELKDSFYSNVYCYSRLIQQQKQILESLHLMQIPVVVVKGTSASKYYPKPQFRTMGDIDLLVKPQDYERAVECLLSIGCTETTSLNEKKMERHRSFRFKSSMIELHHHFSLFVDKDKAEALDDLLYKAIHDGSYELPDTENGLVLLSHIRQHLEGGIGLRQIIDWFMYVKACLDDGMWYSSFQDKAQMVGLETLAIVVTRMCQLYLGLTTENITWCINVDESLCENLMKYVLDSGNFGRSRELLQSGGASRIPEIKHPIKLLKYMQMRGEKNWVVLEKHAYLRHFAWIYQLCRYFKLALQKRVGVTGVKNIYDEGRNRNEMFAALGLK